MPTYALSVPLWHCGHWSDSAQSEVDYTSLRLSARNCASCRTLLECIRTMHLSREEQAVPGPTDSVGTSLNVSQKGTEKPQHRIKRKLRSGARYSLKFVKDLGWVITLMGGLIVAPISYPIIICGLNLACCCLCCGCFGFFSDKLPEFRSPCSIVRSISRELREALGDLVGDDYPHNEDPLRETFYLQPDSIEQTFSTVGVRGRTCSFKTQTLAGLSSLQLTNGCSAIILELGRGNDKLRCIFYRHLYRPRGPIGYMIHYCRLKLKRPMNHPTHFLFLFGGRLCLTRCEFAEVIFGLSNNSKGTANGIASSMLGVG